MKVDSGKLRRRLILDIPYLVFGLIYTNLGEAWRMAEGVNASEKLLSFFLTFGVAFASPLPSFHIPNLTVGLICGVYFKLTVHLKGRNTKEYRRSAEYGSARWSGLDGIVSFMGPVFENNVPLTRTRRLTMSNRPKNPANARNKDVLIVDGSDSGKIRFWIKPNLLQLHSSYALADPEGTALLEVGNTFVKAEYRVRSLNTISLKESVHYNPFAYTHSEKDILKLATTLIANAKGDGKIGDEFWTSATCSPAVESWRTYDCGRADD